MKDSSTTTELDEILMSIEGTSDELCFYLNVMKEIGIKIPEYSREEAELIRKSQNESISANERRQIESILSKEKAILDNQEDMVKSYLAQCNRNQKPASLNIH